jgi:AcrR family transcriptional regulator
LAFSRGLRGVTMAAVAEATGIGRATLYKHFPDIESILIAWHQQQVDEHLTALADAAGREDDPVGRVRAVLRSYATITRRATHDPELSAFLHRHPHVAESRRRLSNLLAAVIADAVAAGVARSDVPPEELAEWSLHAMAAARARSADRIERLIGLTLAGMGVAPADRSE